VKVDISWSGGIVFTLNHCAVRDALAESAATTGIATLIASDCPNMFCKAAAAGIVTFLVSQAVELQDVDSQCGNQGSIIEIGSFKDKSVWRIKPICGIASGHLTITDNNQNGESNLKCGTIYLSFALSNIGEVAMKWHLAIYYGNSNLQPSNLQAYIVEEGGKHIRTGKKPGTYDEEGLLTDQTVTVAITGSIDANKIKQYRQVTLRYLGVGGDNQNPAPIAIKCS